ncbi:DUF4190 domain-containing protein [Salinispora arenicola]|uniref:DUF4190 domain-containing protein n=1 Tax=Salinispora arenicola TaxID=168697 RepID=UPI0003130B7D|nr:DUF4190 domain-containing protein [Salinispora arenicola]NIL56977.1 DUF4190 domain-containing protein [Salinispora arenicola]NIL64149.1 DUF4190 domain-containing protein [Salinispora arenicola]
MVSRLSHVAEEGWYPALREIRERSRRGDGMAKAGLVLGYLLVMPMLVMSFQAVLGVGLSVFQ